MYDKKAIGLDEALGAIQAMLHEVRSKSDEYWQHAAIAITDERGDLICFARMDSPSYIPVIMSQMKAYTAAIWGMDTHKLFEAMKERPWEFQGNYGPGMTLVWGGNCISEPGYVEGQFPVSIGAIGVSGAGPAVKDEEIALVGVKYIQNALWPSK